MKKQLFPSTGGSFLRAKDGTLKPNPDNQSAAKPVPESDIKTGVKPVKKEA